MALADFVNALQEEDIIYSKPENPTQKTPYLKVNLPESNTPTNNTPKKIKIKISTSTINTNTNTNTNTKLNIKQETIESKSDDKSNINENDLNKNLNSDQINNDKTDNYQIHNNLVNNSSINEKKEILEEDLFISSGTEYSKKEIWIKYYNQAKSSKKKNPIVDRMKLGRFTITPDNQVLLLPDYDIVGKDPDDVLKDKWF